jgi:hypothetical protein
LEETRVRNGNLDRGPFAYFAYNVNARWARFE